MKHIEYRCTVCREIYLPEEPGDGHIYKEDGTECVSPGEFSRALHTEGDNFTPREMHFWVMPGCTDSDCEFHHPEVIEMSTPTPEASEFVIRCYGCGEVFDDLQIAQQHSVDSLLGELEGPDADDCDNTWEIMPREAAF